VAALKREKDPEKTANLKKDLLSVSHTRDHTIRKMVMLRLQVNLTEKAEATRKIRARAVSKSMLTEIQGNLLEKERKEIQVKKDLRQETVFQINQENLLVVPRGAVNLQESEVAVLQGRRNFLKKLKAGIQNVQREKHHGKNSSPRHNRKKSVSINTLPIAVCVQDVRQTN
jgi:hypothetical protein